MKIRKGFVSNSSSSSFIIQYNKYEGDKEITKEQLLVIMNKLVEIEQVFNPKIKFEDIFTLDGNAEDMCIGKKGDNIIERRKNWEIRDYNTEDRTDFEKVKGKLIVSSVDDNTVPHWMHDFFETKLGTLYWHWG